METPNTNTAPTGETEAPVIPTSTEATQQAPAATPVPATEAPTEVEQPAATVEAPKEPAKVDPNSFAYLLNLADTAAPTFLQLLREQMGLKSKADTARDTYRDNVPVTGKMMCAEKVVFEKQQAAGAIPNTVSFTEHFKTLMGLKKDPDSRAFSCCKTYAWYVLSGKFDEELYDNSTADVLQLCSRIVTKVKNDANHAAVAEATKQMKKAGSKNLAKNLRRILDRIQTVVTGEKGKEVETLVFISDEELTKQETTPEQTDVAQIAGNLSKTPTGLGALIAAILATAQTTDSAETTQALCHLQVQLPEALSANIVEKDGVKTRRFEAKQLMAWGNEVANQAPAIRTEDDVRIEAMAAMELIDALLKQHNGSKKALKAWIDGAAVNA